MADISALELRLKALEAQVLALRSPQTINFPNDSSQFLNGINQFSTPSGSSPGSISLTNNHIIVGNGSNVGADVAMSSDATIVASGALTLATSGVGAATYGDATHVAQVTFDAKGRATSASNIAIAGASGTIGPAKGVYDARTAATPLASGFSWLNQGTASVADGTNALILTAVNSTINVRGQEINAPATTFDVYCYERTLGTSTDFVSEGIYCRNSTSGRLITIGHLASAQKKQFARWASPTSFNTSLGTDASYFQTTTAGLYWRFNVTSTVITAYISPDGLNWTVYGTETIATYLTATGGSLDKIGFFCNPQGADAIMHVYMFSTTAPT